jgi:hypothetical protein
LLTKFLGGRDSGNFFEAPVDDIVADLDQALPHS